MTRLTSNFAAFAPTQLLRRRFDNVTGRRFRRIARGFCGGRQGLNQLEVFGLDLRQAGLQLSAVFSQASILGLDLAAALFPTKESHASDCATEDLAKLGAQFLTAYGFAKIAPS